MDTYNLSPVQSITGSRSNVYDGFNVTGIHGRPLLNLAFETRDEAIAARKAMAPIMAKVLMATAYT
jgi:hypothetical protein